jgi:hypothetical protein
MRSRSVTMRPRSVTATLAVTAGLSVLAAAAPVLAGSGPPPPGGGTYAHAVYSHITITGQGGGGPAVSTAQYFGPPCWLEPRFPGTRSWQPGDPVTLTAAGDADEYWWWFAQQQPQFAVGLGSSAQVRQEINRSFRRRQGGDGWWWVPAWLQGSAGLACAQGLVASLGLNNGFLEYTRPQVPPERNAPGLVNPLILREMARAALRLPGFTVATNPGPGRDDVNLPVWVWVRYTGPEQGSRTASVRLPSGALMWARVWTSAPTLAVSAGTAQARVYQQCGPAGSRYTGQAAALPPCGVTFLAPSTAGPYPLTVTATWRIYWADSTGAHGRFPPGVRVRTVPVSVREIQAINGGR